MGCCGSSCVDENNVSLSEDVGVNKDSLLIQQYIKEDCDFRKSKGSSINFDKQSKIQRIEIICMGCFLSRSRELIKENKIEILFRDNAIEGTKYRPDLLFRKNYGKDFKIYHIEIDENSHSGYDDEKERNRYSTIKDYCLTRYGSYNLIRFNPNVYGKLETEHDKLIMAEQFASLLSGADGLIYFEMNG